MKTKKVWWKVILIIFTGSFFDMVLHAIISPLNSSNVSLFKPSIFVNQGILIPAVIGWELLTFSVLALVFLLIQNHLPGKRWAKGFFYGLSFGGLYLIGMFESVLLLNSTMLSELLMGLADFLPILTAGILLGIFTGTDGSQNWKKQNIMQVIVVTIFYIAGRYFSYTVLHIQSAYLTKPLGTLIWTICLGLWAGIIYFILQQGIKGKSVISQALFFGVLIFGSNWLMNHLFIAVIAELSSDLFIRAGIDVLFITVGVIVCRNPIIGKMVPSS